MRPFVFERTVDLASSRAEVWTLLREVLSLKSLAVGDAVLPQDRRNDGRSTQLFEHPESAAVAEPHSPGLDADA